MTMLRYRNLPHAVWLEIVPKLHSPNEIAVLIYLIAGLQANRCGLYQLSLGRMSEDLRLSTQETRQAFDAVLRTTGWPYDEENRVLWIPQWWGWNPPQNANVLRGAMKDLTGVPVCPLVHEFRNHIETLHPDYHEIFGQTFDERYPQSSPKCSPERSPKGSPNRKGKRKQKKEGERESGTPPPSADGPFSHPSESIAYDVGSSQGNPSEDNPGRATLSVATWQAYAEAYHRRYGKLPVRNAMVNSQLSQLIKRLGAEAPMVAAFYVNHSNPFYVRKNHTVGPLLADAEGLQNQWARGVTTTTREANSAETRSNLVEQLRRINGTTKPVIDITPKKGITNGTPDCE